ncbi:hypothetical protein ElyMa_000568800 [Elysia marginata]|uniref:Reverse transcriptase zinc-binding domain-containing protein n=1 Tax=Elysia marginata TaxID=1093978 RepID=A0AAV4G351_9GAST|nr:hypothetical protein ElyMa_000568800 [Elysia marginata]
MSLHCGFTYQEAKSSYKLSSHDENSISRIGPMTQSLVCTYHDQVTIFRLTSFYNKLRHHTYSSLKVGDSSGCPCGAPRQDASHIRQDCPLLEEAINWLFEF